MGRYPQMRRRPLAAEPIAVRRLPWARRVTLPSPGGTAGEARVSWTAPTALSTFMSSSGYGKIPAPLAPHYRGDGRRTIGEIRAILKPKPRGGYASEQAKASRHTQARENRRSQAERAGGRARAGWDATTLERLIVKGLTRYCYGIDNEVRRVLGRDRAAPDRQCPGRRGRRDRRARTHDVEVPACGASVGPGPPSASLQRPLGVPTQTDPVWQGAGQRAGALHPAQRVHRTARTLTSKEESTMSGPITRAQLLRGCSTWLNER